MHGRRPCGLTVPCMQCSTSHNSTILLFFLSFRHFFCLLRFFLPSFLSLFKTMHSFLDPHFPARKKDVVNQCLEFVLDHRRWTHIVINVSLIVRDKVTKTASINYNPFEERGKPKRNRTEGLLLTSLTPYR